MIQCGACWGACLSQLFVSKGKATAVLPSLSHLSDAHEDPPLSSSHPAAAGEGPVYGVLRLLVLGQSPDMLPTTQAESREQGGGGVNSAVKLVVCIVGLQVSYLTWGVLQVHTHMHAHTHTYNTHTHHTPHTLHTMPII